MTEMPEHDAPSLWQAEEKFWTAGEAHYREMLHPDCIMAFPAPVGLLAGTSITETLRGAPRWSSVRMTERRVNRAAPDVVVLAYRAEGRREGAPEYVAYCTSTYCRGPDGWRLIQHQQSPGA